MNVDTASGGKGGVCVSVLVDDSLVICWSFEVNRTLRSFGWVLMSVMKLTKVRSSWG